MAWRRIILYSQVIAILDSSMQASRPFSPYNVASLSASSSYDSGDVDLVPEGDRHERDKHKEDMACRRIMRSHPRSDVVARRSEGSKAKS